MVSSYLQQRLRNLDEVLLGQIAAGDTVSHPDFGDGIVRAIGADQNPPDALVEFAAGPRLVYLRHLTKLHGEPQL